MDKKKQTDASAIKDESSLPQLKVVKKKKKKDKSVEEKKEKK